MRSLGTGGPFCGFSATAVGTEQNSFNGDCVSLATIVKTATTKALLDQIQTDGRTVALEEEPRRCGRRIIKTFPTMTKRSTATAKAVGGGGGPPPSAYRFVS